MRIRNAFEEIFCLRSNLKNDEIISAKSLGLKTTLENDIFWPEIGSGFGENGRHTPTKYSLEYLPGAGCRITSRSLQIETTSFNMLEVPVTLSVCLELDRNMFLRNCQLGFQRARLKKF